MTQNNTMCPGLPDRRPPRWSALLLAGLAWHALADGRERPAQGSSYFTTRPADGPRPRTEGGPYIPGEYVPPPQPLSTGTPRADVSAPTSVDPSPGATSDTDLVLAVMRNDIAGAQALIKAGANVNCSQCATGRNAGQTPLMLATQYGANRPQNNMLRLLLRHGANPNARRRDGATALFLAAKAGLHPGGGALDTVTELLIAGADPSLEAADGTTAIFDWAVHGIDPRYDPSPQRRDERYRDFLAIAASFHVRGADLSHREKSHGMTALHAAALACNPHGVLMMQAIGLDAATGDGRLMAPKELVGRRMRDEGESRPCRQTLDALNNRDLVDHWRRTAFQVAPLVQAGR